MTTSLAHKMPPPSIWRAIYHGLMVQDGIRRHTDFVRRRQLADAHRYGRHQARRNPDCAGCQLDQILEARHSARLVTEPFASAFSAPPIPRGFRR